MATPFLYPLFLFAGPADVDPLDSLEAEMARLLGRPGEKE
jgi:hypothetical protein